MKTEAERQLAALVGMPTITDDIPANDIALDYIQDYLAERGMYTERLRYDGHGALIANTRSNGRKKSTVMLAAHVDVMTGDESLFALQMSGDKLTGRGTYDMKFAIAAYMQLVDELQDTLDRYDFSIMITTDEEYGGRNGINAVPHLLKAGYVPDVCILPDGGTDYKVERLAKGHWRFELIANGRTAHGSRPWEGDSASFKLIEALRELKEHFKDHGPLTNTLNIGFIHGGATYNQIPDYMTAAVEIRIIDDGSRQELERLVEAICKKHDVSYEHRVSHTVAVTDLHNPLVADFMRSIETITGEPAKSCISYAASDGFYFSGLKIPCILTRPTGGEHHGANEWISRASFLQLTPILRDYIEKTARIAATPVDTVAAVR